MILQSCPASSLIECGLPLGRSYAFGWTGYLWGRASPGEELTSEVPVSNSASIWEKEHLVLKGGSGLRRPVLPTGVSTDLC